MMYTVFISMLTKLYADKIVAGLVRLGYGVAPAGGSGYLVYGDDSPAAILSMRITTDLPEQETLRDKIRAFLNESEISYYSIVVVNGQPGTAWAGSNISLNKIKQRAVVRKNVPYLKLVRKTPPPLPDSE